MTPAMSDEILTRKSTAQDDAGDVRGDPHALEIRGLRMTD
jgi:hypothetical protein